MDLEERITELETRLAFQETTMQELNEVLTSQQQQLTRMRVLVEKLQERMMEIVNKIQPDAATEPLPPHY